ncbi:MAG: exopolysaccharide biosynthesis polyprenyl glycosylphosphotransferase [Sphingopyxis sp.]|nr:exopolysaccharide biosynthesis polyprenyl glycosylphosphotransferase [Sphingopyxis sp.]
MNIETASMKPDPVDAVPTRPVQSRQRARIAAYFSFGLVDSLSILLAFTLAEQIREDVYLEPAGVDLGLTTLGIYLLIAANQSAYSLNVLESYFESARRALFALILTALIIVLTTFATKTGVLVSRVGFASALAMSVIGIAGGRLICHRMYYQQLRGRLTDNLFIIDGGDPPPAGHGCVVMNARTAGLEPDLADPAMLNRIAELVRPFDRVIISCPMKRQSLWSIILKGSSVSGEFMLQGNQRLGAIGLNEVGGTDTLLVSRGPLSLTNRIKKRAFDLAVAIPAIIFLSPLLLLVWVAIKLESPGPALFKQARVGQGNSMFMILKFRSMRTEQCDAAGNQSTQRDDDRITRVGRIIRATSIDELPQLFNVLRGDMSIVGPRPHALGSLAGDRLFWEVSEQYWVRHALKPGITGLAQIRGFRGATARRSDLEQRLQSDLEYVNGWRLSRDVAIVLGTLKVLVHPNAY